MRIFSDLHYLFNTLVFCNREIKEANLFYLPCIVKSGLVVAPGEGMRGPNPVAPVKLPLVDLIHSPVFETFKPGVEALCADLCPAETLKKLGGKLR